MMLPRTWDPSPSSKRPPDRACRSQAATATAIGLRGNTTSTLVATRSRLVACSAIWQVRRPSWTASGTFSPS